MERLRVRVYNVRFGDAILLSVPDRDGHGSPVTRHILIDVGNVAASTEGGKDLVFRPVVEDVLNELDGRALDLYVMTHEHLDHVQGLLYADTRHGLKLKATHAWLTASSGDGYYDNHPKARKKKLEMLEAYRGIERFLSAAAEPETWWMRSLMLNNNPQNTTDCVRYLKGLATHTTYVYRGVKLAGKHPFRVARLAVLAPEEDTSVYYDHAQPVALDLTPPAKPGDRPTLTVPHPPAGVDAGAFYNLVQRRRQGHVDNLLAIDRAANDTSVVLQIEWRGVRLMFPGDAEIGSWSAMASHDVLRRVDLLKVGHHGSANGTPSPELLNRILPPAAGSAQKPVAVVSTYPHTYSGVPDSATLEALRARTRLSDLHGVPDGGHIDLFFEPKTDD